MPSLLDQRPIVVALTGPNGAGKSTFYYAHLQPPGLRLVNADALARELNIDPYEAANIAASIRRELIRQRGKLCLGVFQSETNSHSSERQPPRATQF